jgi:hypothetical protein
LKKPTGSVRFRFYKPETEKTEPNPNRKKLEKKPSQTGKNRAKTEPKSIQIEKTEPNRFEPVFVKKTESNQNRSV